MIIEPTFWPTAFVPNVLAYFPCTEMLLGGITVWQYQLLLMGRVLLSLDPFRCRNKDPIYFIVTYEL